MSEQPMMRRYVVVVDVLADDLDEVDATYDDVKDSLAARLEEFYPVGGYPARGYVEAVAEVTESYGVVMMALDVGLEGAHDDTHGLGFEKRQLDEADVAWQRLKEADQ